MGIGGGTRRGRREKRMVRDRILWHECQAGPGCAAGTHGSQIWIKLKAHHGVLVRFLLQVVPLQDPVDGTATLGSTLCRGKGLLLCFSLPPTTPWGWDKRPSVSLSLARGNVPFASSKAKDTQKPRCPAPERAQKYLVIVTTDHDHKGFSRAKICNI